MKCNASANPPANCTSLTITTTYDKYPEETGYQLLDAHNDMQPMVFHQPGSTVVEAQQTVTQTYHVPKGDYRLQVSDTMLDGFCCLHGDGQIVVTDDAKGEEYTLSGEFTGESVTLDIPDLGVIPPTTGPATAESAPTPAPGPCYGIQVMIMYDDHPEYITWRLYSQSLTSSDLQLMYEDSPSSARALDENNRQIKRFLDLEEGLYQIHVLDSSTNGMNPGQGLGRGFVRVFQLNNDTGEYEKLLYHINGFQIGSQARGRFQLPAP